MQLYFLGLVLLSDWFLARREKRIHAARETAREEGYAEGYAAAKAEDGRDSSCKS